MKLEARLYPHNKQPHKLPAENRHCSCLLISLHIYVISWSSNWMLKKVGATKLRRLICDVSHKTAHSNRALDLFRQTFRFRNAGCF
jgi:hypothetical protein